MAIQRPTAEQLQELASRLHISLTLLSLRSIWR